MTASDTLLSDGDLGAGRFTVTLVFNETMTRTASPSVEFIPNVAGGAAPTLTNPSAGTWSRRSRPDDTFTVVYDVSDNDVDVRDIAIDVAGAKDLAGNDQEDYAPQAEFDIDTRNPAVASSVPSTVGPTNADSLVFTVEFDETVSSVTADDFQLTTTGTAAGVVADVSPGSGTSFTVTVESIAGDGTLRLDLNSGTDVEDPAGNLATAFTGGDSVAIDNTPPAMTAWTLTDDTGDSPSDRLTSDGMPVLEFAFSEVVFGAGSDIVVLDPYSAPVAPDVIAGWGTSTLTLTFTTGLMVDGPYTVTLKGSIRRHRRQPVGRRDGPGRSVHLGYPRAHGRHPRTSPPTRAARPSIPSPSRSASRSPASIWPTSR